MAGVSFCLGSEVQRLVLAISIDTEFIHKLSLLFAELDLLSTLCFSSFQLDELVHGNFVDGSAKTT